MNDAILWLIVLLIIGLAFWSLIRESDRRSRRSVEEYERDVIENKNTLLRAGMLELDKFVGNESQKRAAVEYLKDEQQGQTKTGGKNDEADRTSDSER
jgi:hypothetical protein